MKLCFIGIHDWGKFGEELPNFSFGYSEFEIRRCKCCGRTQQKKIGWYRG